MRIDSPSFELKRDRQQPFQMLSTQDVLGFCIWMLDRVIGEQG